MKIDCISDLHGNYPELPGGDLLIVAGDLTCTDTYQSYIHFVYWLGKQDYSKIVIVAGNHDNKIEKTDIIQDAFYPFHYLQDSGTEFEGIKIWGSPWTLTFPGINPRCKAFTVHSDKELRDKWDIIPANTDILITHMPPFRILDKIKEKQYVGSKSLRNIVLNERLPKLKLHIFGHIHECGGRLHNDTLCKFVNASHVNEFYDPVNKYVRVEL